MWGEKNYEHCKHLTCPSFPFWALWTIIESKYVNINQKYKFKHNFEHCKHFTCPFFPFWALWTSSGKHWARVASCGISPFRLKLWFMLNFSSLCLFVLYLYFDYCEHCLADIERVLPVMVFHLWNYGWCWIHFQKCYEYLFKQICFFGKPIFSQFLLICFIFVAALQSICGRIISPIYVAKILKIIQLCVILVL